ncbi:MAG: hypothetical protein ABW184_01085 [Sphingobium sp.]
MARVAIAHDLTAKNMADAGALEKKYMVRHSQDGFLDSDLAL